MKKYFITGLIILLPLALTVVIVAFLINLLTQPFVEGMQSILDYYGFLHRDFLFISSKQLQYYFSQFLVLFSLFFFTIFLGFVTRLFIFHYLIKAWDYMLHRIPVIRSVYKTSQDVINTILKSDTTSFKQVVVVPFPHKGCHSIGLITKDNLSGFMETNGKRYISVFVPTTPNPTSGYLVVYDEADIVYSDMRVEDAFKYIISCGVILNEPINSVAKNL